MKNIMRESYVSARKFPLIFHSVGPTSQSLSSLIEFQIEFQIQHRVRWHQCVTSYTMSESSCLLGGALQMSPSHRHSLEESVCRRLTMFLHFVFAGIEQLVRDLAIYSINLSDTIATASLYANFFFQTKEKKRNWLLKNTMRAQANAERNSTVMIIYISWISKIKRLYRIKARGWPR